MANSNGSKAQQKKRSAKTWKRAGAEEVALPSGNTCLAKRPGPAAILQRGIMPDSLMPIVQAAITKNRGLPPEKVEEMTQSPEMIADMLDAIDRLMAVIVVEPQVKYHRIPVLDANGEETDKWVDIGIDDRDEEILYTDDVDLDDKMFLFQYSVGGTRDWEKFRREQQQAVGSMGAVEAPQGSAQ